MAKVEVTGSSGGGGKLCRLRPVWDYVVALAVAHIPVLLVFVQGLVLVGMPSAAQPPPSSNPGGALFVFFVAFAFLPAVVVGVFYGIMRRSRYAILNAVGRIVAALMVALLGIWVSVAGLVFVASYGDQGPKAAPLPIPIGVPISALVVMESALAISCCAALLTWQTLSSTPQRSEDETAQD